MQIRVGIPTLLGGALDGAGLWHLFKWVLDWTGRYDAGHGIPEKLAGVMVDFPWFYGLLVLVGVAFIWWDRHRGTKEISVTITPLLAAAVLTVCAIGAWGWFIYDRAQGPIVWDFRSVGTPISWSSSGDDPIYFSAFQIQAFNRSNDPVTATKAYLRSNMTDTVVQLLFGGDIPIDKGIIQPQAGFALISAPGAWRNPSAKPNAAAIRAEFGSFTFIFESPQKNYSIRFERNDVDRMIETAERELARAPKPTVIPRR